MVIGILDAFDIDAADIVGHDWGAALAWVTATVHPDRVHKLVVLFVPHPLAPRTLRQRERACRGYKRDAAMGRNKHLIATRDPTGDY
jgi:pimeloyl-ACP methyl ester carboxylesterase